MHTLDDEPIKQTTTEGEKTAQAQSSISPTNAIPTAPADPGVDQENSPEPTLDHTDDHQEHIESPDKIEDQDQTVVPPLHTENENDEEQDRKDIEHTMTMTIQIPKITETQKEDTNADLQTDTDHVDSSSEEESTISRLSEKQTPQQATTEPPTAQSSPQPIIPYMDIDNLLSFKIASDQQISPDGQMIAFTVQECDRERDRSVSSIWLVGNSGDPTQTARQLTSGHFNDTRPSWSPDGKSLAFISDRTGSRQIYILPLNGGEPRQVGYLTQGVSAYSWHPEGNMFLVESAWKPIDDLQDPPPVYPLISTYTRLDDQWNAQGYTSHRYQQLWLLALDGQTTRLTSEPVHLKQSCWSPDGQEIAFSANRRSDPDLSASTAIWILTLATGQMRRLTPEMGQAQMPSWSPDGQTIAYLFSPDQTEAGNVVPWIREVHNTTAVARPAVAQATHLTCQAWIIDELRNEYLARPAWYPDSQTLLVSAQERGQLHLYRLDIQQNRMERLTRGNGRYIHPIISKDGQTIALIRADWFTPGDVWSMDSQGKHLRKLTKLNDTLLQSHQLIRPKKITWHSPDGLQIEGLLYMPGLQPGKKAPLIVTPHGGPSLAWGDGYVHEFQVLAGKGYAILAPNPRGSAGYGEDFSRRVINDWGGADLRDIMAGIEFVTQTEAIDAQRIGLNGLSYGGYLTNFALTQTTRFKAAVSRNGISSLTSATALSDQTLWLQASMGNAQIREQRSALPLVENMKTPLLLLHAENDLRCPFSEAYQLFTALRQKKNVVELVRYHQTSHLMDWPTIGTPQQRTDRLRRTLQWFERFL